MSFDSFASLASYTSLAFSAFLLLLSESRIKRMTLISRIYFSMLTVPMFNQCNPSIHLIHDSENYHLL